MFISLGFAIYGDVINGAFVWDDFDNVVNNTFIRSPSNVSDFFTKNLIAGAGKTIDWYRPILLVSYSIDYSLWGLNPIGYHIVNILFHIVSAAILFIIVNKLFNKTTIAWWASILFLIHPVQTEAVSYISGRADLLIVFFLLLSFYFFLLFHKSANHKKRTTFFTLSLFSFSIALFSKETAFIFPGILLLYHITFNEKINTTQIKQAFITATPFIFMSGAYLILRLMVLNFSGTFSSAGENIFQRTLVFIKLLPEYWWILIAPMGLHYRVVRNIDASVGDLAVIFSLAIIISVIFSIIWFKKYRKILLFGFGWFFLSIFPASNTIVPINFLIGERWLYLSAIGLFISTAFFLDVLLQKFSKSEEVRFFIMSLLIIYSAFFIVIGIDRNLDWKEETTILAHTLIYAPDDAHLHTDLAIAYAEKGEYEKALTEFQKAANLNPNEYNIYFNIGVLYENIRNFEKALEAYERVVVLKADYAPVYNKLANFYVNAKRYDDAIVALEQLKELLPDSWKSYSLLGQVYVLKGNFIRAREYFEKALTLDPGNVSLQERLKILRTP